MSPDEKIAIVRAAGTQISKAIGPRRVAYAVIICELGEGQAVADTNVPPRLLQALLKHVSRTMPGAWIGPVREAPPEAQP